MSEMTLEALAVAFLVSGGLAWVAAPLLERRAGEEGFTAAFIAGLLLLLGCGATGIASGTGQGRGIATCGAAVVVWAAVSYTNFKLTKTEKEPRGTVGSGAECTTKLVVGVHADPPVTQVNRWFSYLRAKFETEPTDGALCAYAWAVGAAWRILYYRRGEGELRPTTQIECLEGPDTACLVAAIEQGEYEREDGPVRLYLHQQLETEGAVVRIRLVGLAGLGVSDGPQISASRGSSPSFGLPAATLQTKSSLGSYVWVCAQSH